MEYPKYVSHKTVSAVKISNVEKGADGSLHVGLEGGFDKVIVTHEQARRKPEPQIGWYLVQYADGYLSFSPAEAFEEGYTLLEDTDVAEEPPVEVVQALVKRADDHTFNVIKGSVCIGNYVNVDEAFDVAEAENVPVEETANAT